MQDGRIRLDCPPRGAWADPEPWQASGTGIPDVVRLAAAVPGAFPGGIPLSADEAAEALRGTWFQQALAHDAARRRDTAAPRAPAGDEPPLLSWDGVTVAFGGTRAVDNVSLDIREGEWAALIGANGSGKSTLTGLPAGLGVPASGTVRFRGRPVRPGRVFEQAAHVALLLQAADEMLFAASVQAELEFGFRFRARPERPVLDVAEAIGFFGFAGLEQASPWELSQGGRQRLALAALLVGAPGVLLLDEPTTGQDASRMRAFLRLLDQIRDRTGLTVVTITHDMRAVASRSSRVILLGDGQVRLDGTPSQVFARPGELARWGILAPPLARLQTALLGEAAGEVLLSVEALSAAALRGQPAGQPAAGQPGGAVRLP
jgi:energy-coupling factor transport system ATP-binding protein